MFHILLTVLMASQSEITRRLEESGVENHELEVGSQGFLSRSEISHGEHPLSLGKSSIWNQFFKVLFSSSNKKHILLSECHVILLMISFSRAGCLVFECSGYQS